MTFESGCIAATFACYLAGMLAIGWIFFKRTKNISDYILGGRSLNGWVTAISAQASDMSAWLLIGLPGLAFASGLGTVWVGVGCCSGIAFSWFVVARRLREETERVGALTLADYFAARFPGRRPTLLPTHRPWVALQVLHPLPTRSSTTRPTRWRRFPMCR